MKIEIVVGNIVKQPDIEAVVNSANANLRLGSGVVGAIHMGGCPKFCVNGQMAGNCRTSRKMNHDRQQRIDRPATGWL
jgi:O-acetyl-ADP-ribose deacetylase (regulator of RNase III)